MPFSNPFRNNEGENATPPNPEATTPKPPEKTQAELLAEAVTGALKPVADAVAAVTSKVDALEQRFQKPPVESAETQFTSVFDDENRAIGERVAKMVGPLYQSQLETQAKIAFNEVRDEYAAKGYSEVFTQFADKITAILDNTPLLDSDGKPLRGSKSYIRNTVNMVFGDAAMAAGMKFGGKDKGFFIESAGSSAEAAAGFRQGDGLTEGQRKVFSRMKVSPEDAKKTIAKLQFVS